MPESRIIRSRLRSACRRFSSEVSFSSTSLRQATEQRQQRLEHELTELRQHLLAQQTRLGGLQTQEQRLAQDNDRLQNTLLRAKEALTQSRSAHEHLVFQFAAAAENAAPA